MAAFWILFEYLPQHIRESDQRDSHRYLRDATTLTGICGEASGSAAWLIANIFSWITVTFTRPPPNQTNAFCKHDWNQDAVLRGWKSIQKYNKKRVKIMLNKLLFFKKTSLSDGSISCFLRWLYLIKICIKVNESVLQSLTLVPQCIVKIMKMRIHQTIVSELISSWQ